MFYTERETCRLCNGTLDPVISLGDIHLSTFLDTNDNPPPKIPLDLMICHDCQLVQLRHTVSSELMYSDYWYQSGLNGSMMRALNEVVEEVFKHISLNENDIVVDIGSNDGTLLSFYPRYLFRYGFEPSNLWKLSIGKVDDVANDYFNKERFIQQFGEAKAKVITAIAMFYDLKDPHIFVQDLKDILAPDGMIVIQMMDLLSMVKMNDFPNICHEHLEYYTLSSLCNLMYEHGLEVTDVQYNGVNGGSLRAYIHHEGYTEINENVIASVFAEKEFFDDIGDLGTYFRKAIETVREKIVNIIYDLNKAGYTIAVMGASTKGNTILQYFGLTDKDIIHAAEVNPDKYGKRTVGSDIPIISQEQSMKFFVDYYLILPWGFISNFIDRNKSYLLAGGQFIVPLPHPRIIGMSKDGNVLWTRML